MYKVTFYFKTSVGTLSCFMELPAENHTDAISKASLSSEIKGNYFKVTSERID